MSPGPRQPSAATPSSIEGLVRRATPYSIAGLVALYGLAAAGLSLAGLSGPSAALALLVGLILLFAVVVAVVNRDARRVAATVERESRTVRDSVAWVRMALDHADVGMGIIDSRGSWLHVNSRLGAMLGRSEADLLAMRDRYGNETLLVRNSGQITRLLTPNGRTVDLTYNASSQITSEPGVLCCSPRTRS